MECDLRSQEWNLASDRNWSWNDTATDLPRFRDRDVGGVLGCRWCFRHGGAEKAHRRIFAGAGAVLDVHRRGSLVDLQWVTSPGATA